MELAVVAVAISAVALLLSVLNTMAAARQRSRQEDAAVTGDLYPVLRALRDAAWQYAKPLGGQQGDDLVAMHSGLIDLADLRPAVQDKSLRAHVEALLGHESASLALSVDPPRFMGAAFSDDAIALFHDFAEQAHAAVERCQELRRGTA